MFLLLFIQYGEFDQQTTEQSQVNHIAIEEELVVSKRHDDFHRCYRNDVDGYNLQIGIFKLTYNEASSYDDRANQKPQGEETYWPQIYPYPVDRVMRDIVVIGIACKYVWEDAYQRLWLEKWSAKAEAQRIMLCRILQIIIFIGAIEV
jgi:hypothetical protein